MIQWLTEHFGLSVAVIFVLGAAAFWLGIYYIRLYIQQVADPDGAVERKIDQQTDHIDERLDDLSERITAVDKNAKRRDEDIREWAREEFARSDAVSRLRSDVADMRSDVMTALGQVQSQMTDLMNTLIAD